MEIKTDNQSVAMLAITYDVTKRFAKSSTEDIDTFLERFYKIYNAIWEAGRRQPSKYDVEES